jgi:hypothetical protein
MEKILTMKFKYLSLPGWRTCLFIALCCVCGCGKPGMENRSENISKSVNGAPESFSADLSLVEMINPKPGGPEADPIVSNILAAGTNAVPFLIGKIIDDTPSRFGDGFQYRIGDIAHRLLCDIYGGDFLWPVADATPIGGHPQVTWQDYLALVGEPVGRKKLQQMWKDRINTIE